MIADYRNTDTTEMYFIDEGETPGVETERQGLIFMLCGFIFVIGLFSLWFFVSPDSAQAEDGSASSEVHSEPEEKILELEEE